MKLIERLLEELYVLRGVIKLLSDRFTKMASLVVHLLLHVKSDHCEILALTI